MMESSLSRNMSYSKPGRLISWPGFEYAMPHIEYSKYFFKRYGFVTVVNKIYLAIACH